MTFANVLESQIKFLTCLESKAGSETPLVHFMCVASRVEMTYSHRDGLSQALTNVQVQAFSRLSQSSFRVNSVLPLSFQSVIFSCSHDTSRFL